MSKKYDTAKSPITDAQLARIRTAAHRYVLAGGSIFAMPDMDVANRDEHIATIREALRPKVEPLYDATLERIVPINEHHAEHEELFDITLQLVDADSEAAYLFGVCVGLEIASLTFGTLATTAPTISAGRARKGSQR